MSEQALIQGASAHIALLVVPVVIVVVGAAIAIIILARVQGLSRSEVTGDRVMRCADGHLFTSTVGTRLFGSVHLGAGRWMTCPVDGKQTMVRNVLAKTLGPAELEQAHRYHV